jgi:hypothetical protein
MTRLAFGDSATGSFLKKGDSRHGNGIHFLSVSGTLRTLDPLAAIYSYDPGHADNPANVNPMWQVPKARKFRN